MAKTIVHKLILIVCLLSVVLAGSKAKANLMDDLVAYWPFEDSAEDVIGTNDGTLTGTTSYVAGKVGQAVACNNGSPLNYVSLTTTDSLDGDWTAATWIYVHNQDCSGFLSGGQFDIRCPGQYGALDVPGLTDLVHNINAAWDGVDSQTTAYGTLQNTWVLLVFVGRDTDAIPDGITDEVELFADSVSYNKIIFAEVADMQFTLTWNRIGDLDVYSDYGNAIADYDEVAIWSRALSVADIAELWNDGDGIEILNNLPRNPTPVHDATHVDPTAILNWEAPDVGGTLTYNVYLDTVDGSTEVASGISATSFNPSPDMAFNTKYYWRVDVSVDSVVSTGKVWNFTTGGKATEPVPAIDAMGQSTSTVDLDWTGDTFASSYKVYAGTSFPLTLIDEVVSSEYPGLPTPEELTMYYWQVDEYVGGLLAVAGDLWYFTTRQNPVEPIVGDLNGDWKVDLFDLAVLGAQWQDPAGCVGYPDDCADIVDGDGVNEGDLVRMAENWLRMEAPSVIISEFLTSNNSKLEDPDAFLDEDYDASDWIELRNMMDLPVSLSGWYLTDDKDDLTKWRFPDVFIEASGDSGGGDYFVVFASAKDRAIPGNELHTNFNLDKDGEYLALVMPDGRTIVSEHAPKYPKQATDVSYGIYSDEIRYFDVTTPGAANAGPGYIGIVDTPGFSVGRGFYENPFDLYMTCDTPGATIRYVLSSTVPTGSSTAYTGPVNIDGTKCVRAVGFKTGYIPSRVQTHTYIFPADVVEQSTLDDVIMDDPSWGVAPEDLDEVLLELPTISLVTATTSISETERETSIELIFPDGSDGFQDDAGVERFGGTSLGHAKASLRISFKKIYGNGKLRFDLFGGCTYGGEDATDEFDQILLRSGSHDAMFWVQNTGAKGTYIRNRWMSDRQLETGQPAPRGRFVHVYINGIYWGQYHLMERPNGSFMASYYGGEKDDYDAVKGRGNTQTLSVVNGTSDAWYAMEAAVNDYEQLQQYMDVSNFIDYLLVYFYGGNNWDWRKYQNFAAARKREVGAGFKFFAWDSDVILRTPLNANIVSGGMPGPGNIWVSVKQHEEVRLVMADRAQKYFFNGGILTPDRVLEQIDALADVMERTIILECARWGRYGAGGYYTPTEWRNAVNWMKDERVKKPTAPHEDRRTEITIQQLRDAGIFPLIDAPVFNIEGSYQHGGYISKNDLFSMTAGAGTIYYTLDGTDSRTGDGGSGGGETTTEILIPESTPKTALIPTAVNPSDDTWRTDVNFDDSSWLSGSSGVGYENGSGYEPYFDIDVSAMSGGNTSCYIRIPFTFNGDVNDFNYMKLKVRYDDGFIVYLNGVKVRDANPTVDNPPLWSSNASTSHSDGEAVNLQDFDISISLGLLQQGDNLLAIHGLNYSSGSTDFLISAELVAGETTGGTPLGLSPTAIEYTGPVALDKSVQAKARLFGTGDVWSALNEAAYAIPTVGQKLRITEIMYHPDDPNTEFIELKNIGTTAADDINLNLVSFSAGVGFTFGDVPLAHGDHAVLVQDQAAFAVKYPGVSIAGTYSGRLDNDGDRIKLVDAIGNTIHDFKYKDGWYDITDGDGFSLTIADATNPDPNSWDEKSGWHPSSSSGGTPGADDPGTFYPIGSITINELLAHSDDLIYGDWIELHNTTGSAINIGGWFISDNGGDLTKYEIATDDPRVLVPAGGYVVFDSVNDFQNPGDSGSNVQFGYSENGETAYLTSGLNHAVTGAYSVEEEFDASEVNVAFGRYQKSTGTFNFVAMSEQTAGFANTDPKVGPIVISEIMYNPAPGGTFDNEEYEYIELYNTTDSAVTLHEYDADVGQNIPWKFTDGIEYTFPPGTEIAHHGYLLVVRNTAAFAERYGSPVGAQILGPYGKKLNNDGEKLELAMPGDTDADGRHYIRIDRVIYNDAGDWPQTPDGADDSLTRINKTAYGNDVINWQAADPTPGW